MKDNTLQKLFNNLKDKYNFYFSNNYIINNNLLFINIF